MYNTNVFPTVLYRLIILAFIKNQCMNFFDILQFSVTVF